jgi:hypothetical protein
MILRQQGLERVQCFCQPFTEYAHLDSRTIMVGTLPTQFDAVKVSAASPRHNCRMVRSGRRSDV